VYTFLLIIGKVLPINGKYFHTSSSRMIFINQLIV
jgi:hypothetical protein